MFIYNVTVKIDPTIEADWIKWMKEEHIPEVLATGKFFESRFVRLIDVDESEGPTFAAQYTARTKEDYEDYISHFSPELRKKGLDRWGNLFIAFRTVMQVVE
ncbi:MAG: DUF4286 family protein [Bacteroidota bacterium]